jgi:hypothetical protein
MPKENKMLTFLIIVAISLATLFVIRKDSIIASHKETKTEDKGEEIIR